MGLGRWGQESWCVDSNEVCSRLKDVRLCSRHLCWLPPAPVHWVRPRGQRGKAANKWSVDLPAALTSTPGCKFKCQQKQVRWGLPWWCSGWESACQCRGHGFEPWFGKIPHAAEQLGPWATTTEPARLEPVLHNKRGCDSERPAHRDEEWPPLAATGESPRTEMKTQHSQK